MEDLNFTGIHQESNYYDVYVNGNYIDTKESMDEAIKLLNSLTINGKC